MENIDCQQEIAARALRLMPHTDSLLAQIITGHLLIEERLTALLVTCARDGKFLEHARLSFKQRVLLAQGNIQQAHQALGQQHEQANGHGRDQGQGDLFQNISVERAEQWVAVWSG